MNEHKVYVEGCWHNTGDAGVYVWCETCSTTLIEGDDYGDRLTLEQITTAINSHNVSPAPQPTNNKAPRPLG